MLSEQIEALAKKHGATSYRNRADTQHPAFGFTPAQLLNLLSEITAEVRKQDEALIRQMVTALEAANIALDGESWWREIELFEGAITAARARLGEREPNEQPR